VVASLEHQHHPGHAAKPTRLVFVLDNMRVGGTELNAVRTAESLDRTRFEVQVVALSVDGPLLRRYEAIGVPVTHMPINSLHGRMMLETGWRFARFLRDHRIQIVHAHDMYSNIFAVPWARVAGVPIVIASRRWWHSLPAVQLRVGNRVVFHLAHAVLANSLQVARSLHTTDRVRQRRVRVVTNFVDESAFVEPDVDRRTELRRQLAVGDDMMAIGCVARLDPVKGHDTLLKAFAIVLRAHPNARLVIIGDGPAGAALRQLSVDLGIEASVTFAGERLTGLNHHHVFDVSVLCSLSEGFPNTIIEAMAAGRPIVATAVGGTIDAVRDGLTGILVRPRQPEETATALARLLSDPALRVRLGTEAKRYARENHRRERVIRSLETMYDELLAGQNGQWRRSC
jgi:glycosyltransferase involved in cell wall biosynthesis